MELNFLGTVSLTKQVLPHMTQRGRGSIVTVSSLFGLTAAPLATGASASKHALQVMKFQKGDDDFISLNSFQLNVLVVGSCE